MYALYLVLFAFAKTMYAGRFFYNDIYALDRSTHTFEIMVGYHDVRVQVTAIKYSNDHVVVTTATVIGSNCVLSFSQDGVESLTSTLRDANRIVETLKEVEETFRSKSDVWYDAIEW